MPPPGDVGFDRLLADIARAAPEPWYPLPFLHATGVARSRLEHMIDELRLAGLIELTPWRQNRGQGLRLTSAGTQALLSPRMLDAIARGRLPQAGHIPVDEVDVVDESTTFARGEAVRSALLSRMAPRVTQTLLAMNIAVFAVGFLIELANPGNRIAKDWWTGSVHGPWLLEGQWWRLVSSCFVHHGPMHLFMNMYSLWATGPLSERLWGRGRFITIYLLAGLTGSCVAMARHPESVLAGASGCLWGVMTALLAWIVLNRNHLPRELVSDWGKQLASALVMNAIISFLPGISADAHFAGGAAGVVVALFLHFHRHSRGIVRWMSLAPILLVPVLSGVVLYWATERTLTWHQIKKIHAIQNQQLIDDAEP